MNSYITVTYDKLTTGRNKSFILHFAEECVLQVMFHIVAVFR